MFSTPILFLVFNRPKTTRQVFEKIKTIKPKLLYVAADGPRSDQEKVKCDIVRGIATNVDWNCEVKTLFRTQNLGCGKAVSDGISWFFDNEEQGIILEDDCLPDLSFFNFSEVLLNKYRHDKRVWHISGNNFQNGIKRGDASYYFSMYSHIWGWASWRDRWEAYSIDVSTYDIDSDLLNYTSDKKVAKYFNKHKKRLLLGELDTWDYQYLFSMWQNKGLAVLPNVNLVTNIGFGDGATNTNTDMSFGNLSTKNIVLDKFIDSLNCDEIADSYTFYTVFANSLYNKIIKRLVSILKK